MMATTEQQASAASTEATSKANAFEAEAQDEHVGLVAEFWDYLKENKKWWLIPVIVALLLIGVLFVIAVVAPGAAPFIYTLF